MRDRFQETMMPEISGEINMRLAKQERSDRKCWGENEG